MNKKFVYQVGNNKKVILWCTANQTSNFRVVVRRTDDKSYHSFTLLHSGKYCNWYPCHSLILLDAYFHTSLFVDTAKYNYTFVQSNVVYLKW